MTTRPHGHPLIGIGLVLVGMVILPFIDVIAKFLGQQGLAVAVIVWGRMFFSMCLTLPFVIARHGAGALIPEDPAIQTARGLFLVMATGAFFWALKWLPIADTLAIFFVQPLIVTLLSPVVLGEHVGFRRWSAVATGFVGTLIIIRPGFNELNPGVFLALAAGASLAVYMLLTRLIAGRADAIVTTFHTNVAGAAIMSVVMIWFWQTPSAQQFGLLVLLAAVATTGHYFIVRAYDHAEASLLAPFAYTEMIVATFAGWYFFGDFPDNWTFLGTGILIASALYIAQRERIRQVPPVKDYQQP
jgi:drug/metabolite transporter (DMT)-like permease